MAGGEKLMPEYDELRAKYSQPGVREAAAKELASAPSRQNAASEDRLSKIKICGACQAMGYVTKQYGFRVLQEKCTACDGEGLLGTKEPADELTVEHKRKQRITQIEAAIKQADSLEELETLEAELLRLMAPATGVASELAPAAAASTGLQE